MNADTIREWLCHQPFEPFVLRLSTAKITKSGTPRLSPSAKTESSSSTPTRTAPVYVAVVHVNSIEALQTA